MGNAGHWDHGKWAFKKGDIDLVSIVLEERRSRSDGLHRLIILLDFPSGEGTGRLGH